MPFQSKESHDVTFEIEELELFIVKNKLSTQLLPVV